MKKILVAMTLVLGLTMGACSDDGGSGDVCQQYAAAFKTCVDNLPDCTTFTDATKKLICDALKNPGTGTGTGTGTVVCEGAVKDAATKALAAGFDDVCMPKTTTPDQGTPDQGTPDQGTPDQSTPDA